MFHPDESYSRIYPRVAVDFKTSSLFSFGGNPVSGRRRGCQQGSASACVRAVLFLLASQLLFFASPTVLCFLEMQLDIFLPQRSSHLGCLLLLPGVALSVGLTLKSRLEQIFFSLLPGGLQVISPVFVSQLAGRFPIELLESGLYNKLPQRPALPTMAIIMTCTGQHQTLSAATPRPLAYSHSFCHCSPHCVRSEKPVARALAELGSQ